MYNREYYENERNTFYDTYKDLINDDTALKRSVMASAREQDERLEKAFEENAYLREFTDIAYSMQIETVNDFEDYLAECLGGKVRDGVMALRNKNDAFYSSSNAVMCAQTPTSLTVPTQDSERMILKSSTTTRFSWNRVDGFTTTEITETVPVGKKELQRMIRFHKIFPNYRNRPINDIKIPIHSVIAVLVCMAVLMLPVFLSVIKNEVEVENKEYDAYIRELSEEIDELEAEVALKRDIKLIDTLAREEYGMIDAELAGIERVASSEDVFTIEAVEEEEQKSVWTILLSAIGIID